MTIAMKATHTPGPWRYMTDSTGQYLAVYATPQGGTKVICPVKIADEADARLIAEAPAMADKLRRVLDWIGVDETVGAIGPSLVRDIRAILERIDGDNGE